MKTFWRLLSKQWWGVAVAAVLALTTPAAAQPVNQLVPPSTTGWEKAITLDLRDINVVDVIKFLALEGGLNIVTSKSVQGRSTLLLHNVTIRDALEIIIVSNQLAYEVRNGIVYVMSEDEYFKLYGKNYNDNKKIMTVALKYAKPSYVLSALQSVQSAIGKIIIDEETGSVVLIDTSEKLKQMAALLQEMENKVETRVVKLQYANAKDVETQLKNKLDVKSVGNIFADVRSNQIIISAYPGRMDEVLPLIKELDQKTKAVLIDARVLQVTLNPKFDFGISWEKTFENSASRYWHGLDFKQAFSNPGVFGTSGTSPDVYGKIAVAHTNADNLIADLQMLKQVTATKLLANPRIVAMDRQEAKINIGDKIPYVVTTQTATGTTTATAEDIKWIDVGITLVVTPVINDDGYITMRLRPEISAQTNSITTPVGKTTIPIVSTTFVESNAVVQDGVTIVVGGLRRDSIQSTDKGTPYLMDIPVLGHLFKSRSDNNTRTELVIFLTPKIISGDENITDEFPKVKYPRRGMRKSKVANVKKKVADG